MRTVRIGDSGPAVRTLQEALRASLTRAPIAVDGEFGPNTKSAVLAFQRLVGLYDDGIVGPNTWAKLGVGIVPPEIKDDFVGAKLEWQNLPADAWGDCYDRHTLRSDIAPHYTAAINTLHGAGAMLTSSGSRRRLNTVVSANRSATSLHYVGRALDLFVHSGMNKPESDPYVVTKDKDHPGYWIVFARCNEGRGEDMTLAGWQHSSQAEVRVSGRFVNLTQIMAEHGFERIKARRSYSSSNYGAAEWWHFQCTIGLVPGQTTFGDELLRLYSKAEIIDTPPARHVAAVWQKDWF